MYFYMADSSPGSSPSWIGPGSRAQPVNPTIQFEFTVALESSWLLPYTRSTQPKIATTHDTKLICALLLSQARDVSTDGGDEHHRIASVALEHDVATEWATMKVPVRSC
jgi:hypothetical protein